MSWKRRREWSKLRRGGRDGEDGGSFGMVEGTERMEEGLEWWKGQRGQRKLGSDRKDGEDEGSFGVIEGTERMEEALE